MYHIYLYYSIYISCMHTLQLRNSSPRAFSTAPASQRMKYLGVFRGNASEQLHVWKMHQDWPQNDRCLFVNWGFHGVIGGTPSSLDGFFCSGKSHQSKWMMTWGSPIFGNPLCIMEKMGITTGIPESSYWASFLKRSSSLGVQSKQNSQCARHVTALLSNTYDKPEDIHCSGIS